MLSILIAGVRFQGEQNKEGKQGDIKHITVRMKGRGHSSCGQQGGWRQLRLEAEKCSILP